MNGSVSRRCAKPLGRYVQAADSAVGQRSRIIVVKENINRPKGQKMN